MGDPAAAVAARGRAGVAAARKPPGPVCPGAAARLPARGPGRPARRAGRAARRRAAQAPALDGADPQPPARLDRAARRGRAAELRRGPGRGGDRRQSSRPAAPGGGGDGHRRLAGGGAVLAAPVHRGQRRPGDGRGTRLCARGSLVRPRWRGFGSDSSVRDGEASARITSAAMGKLPLRARLATTVAGAAGRVSRLSGRGDGSVIGGVVGLRMEPDLLRLLAADRQIVLVTGTNGKTTTTRLITAALGAIGQEVASNAFGANMEAGLISALGRAHDAPFGVLEVDERHLPAIMRATRPRVIALLNLSRDQMDRAAEIWLIARRWREALAGAPGC